MIDDDVPAEDQALFDALAALPRPLPPTAMPHSHVLIRGTVVEGRGSRKLPFVIAAAAVFVLAIGGAWWLDRAREERAIASLQHDLAAALTDRSDAVRIHAIAAMSGSSNTDSRMLIVAALTTSLLSDSSTNVRVAAAEALGRIADPAALRDAAEQSLSAEASPFVQAALLTALARLPSGDRATVIATLLARPDLDPVVRAEAAQLAHS